MRRAWPILFLIFLPAGCTSDLQERVRFYNEDGVHLFHQGNYAAARDSFAVAVSLTPEDPALYYNLGQCYDRMGDTAQAERHYNLCLQRSANHAECRHALNELLVREGRREEAVRQVQAWLTSQPKLAAAYAEDGWLCFQAGDLPNAQARLQQALELDQHDERTLIELARVYEAMRRPDRAAALYERILQHNPKQMEVRRRLDQLRTQGAGQPQPD
jgi:tetratricopeptide (TPR) repeat protein